MGVKRIARKNEVNYRRGGTSMHCGCCKHRVATAIRPGDIEERCTVIGLDPGRGYRIHRASVCDRWECRDWVREAAARIGATI